RQVPSDPTQGYCESIIPDPALHACLVSDSDGHTPYIPTTDRIGTSFNAAALQHLETSIDCSNYSITLEDNTPVGISNITGLEHAVLIPSLDLHSNADISDISPLSALTSLEYLFLGGCDIS
ncbi:hypothetical protein ADUPG1_004700, partial [Aduncisulcus paluster]